MISLAASTTSTRISPESGDTRPTAGTGRADGGFSAVLAKQDSQKTEPGEVLSFLRIYLGTLK